MRRFKFAKLVRDKIVEDIIRNGGIPGWRVLSIQEYIQELKKKIFEESSELIDSEGKETTKELADIQEIVDNLLKVLGVSKKELTKAQKEKNLKSGSFKKRHYIDIVEVDDNAGVVKFYLEHPEKYPEVK